MQCGHSQDTTSMAAKAKPKKKAQNKVKQGLKPTPQEKIAESLLLRNPEATKYEISKDMTKMGVYKHQPSAFRMLTKSQYLNEELSYIKAHNREFLNRKIAPQALKIHARVLKDKTISDNDKLPWVKLSHDKVFSEDAPQARAETINIGQIQVLIADTLGVNKCK